MASLPSIQIDVTADPTKAVSGLAAVDKAVANTAKKSTAAVTNTNKVSNAFSGLQNRSRMLVPQLSQVGQQFTATGNLGQALAVQAADIGLAFGVVGTVIGTVAGIALPSIIASFSDAESQIGESNKSLDNFTGSLRSATDLFKIAKGPISDLKAEFGDFAEQVQRSSMVAAQATLSRAMLGYHELSAGVSEGLNNVSEAAIRYAQALDAAAMAETSLGERTISNAAAFEQIDKSVDAAAEKMREAASEIGLTSLQAVSLKDALDSLSQAEGMEQIAVKAGEALDLISGMFSETENIPPEVSNIVTQLDLVLKSAAAATTAMEGMNDVTTSIADETARIAENLGISVNAAMSLQNLQQSLQYSGRGSGLEFSQPEGTGDGQFRPDTSRRGGASRRPNIDSLIKSLQTEREIVDTWYNDSLEKLNNANAAELEAIGGHNQARIRLEKEYQDRLKGLRTGYNGDALSQAGTFFGDMASAFQGGNEKMIKIAEKFAKAEAVINAIRAYTQVAADPSLPWFAKIPAAIGVAAAVTSAASSLSGGGGGPSAPTGAGSASSASSASQGPLDVRLSGVGANDLISGSQLSSLFDRLQDEAGDRGLNVSFAT